MNPKLLRILTAIFAITTFITGLGAYADLLPSQYVKISGIILAAVMGVKDIAVIIGDIADDGLRNNSFKPPGGLMKVLPFCFLLSALCFTACASSKSTDNELRFAQASLSAAQIAYVIADSQLQAKMLDPKVPAWQRLAAAATTKQAKLALDREEARVVQLIKSRAAAEAKAAENALLLPVSAKQVNSPVPIALGY